jgi:hypothetical protein
MYPRQGWNICPTGPYPLVTSHLPQPWLHPRFTACTIQISLPPPAHFHGSIGRCTGSTAATSYHQSACRVSHSLSSSHQMTTLTVAPSSPSSLHARALSSPGAQRYWTTSKRAGSHPSYPATLSTPNIYHQQADQLILANPGSDCEGAMACALTLPSCGLRPPQP